MQGTKTILISAALVCLLISGVLAQAQDRVSLLRLGRRAARTTTTFGLAGSGAADTTFTFAPSTFMSIVLQAHGDSVDITATAYVGVSDKQLVSDDVWEIETSGTHVQMVYLPTTTQSRIVFSGGPNNGSTTTIDSVWAARQW